MNYLVNSVLENNDNKSLDDEKTLNLALETLKRVDMNYVQNNYFQKSNTRKCCKEVVQQTIEELAKKITK